MQLGVNPNTVAAAYRTLRERGVIETAGRRGSRVRSKPATTGREYIRVEVPEGVRNVANGNPDPALLPPLAPAFAAAAEQGDREPVLYGEATVDPSWRAWRERRWMRTAFRRALSPSPQAPWT